MRSPAKIGAVNIRSYAVPGCTPRIWLRRPQVNGLPGLGIGVYRTWVRARDRAFTLAARKAFASFGSKSVIQLPVRLDGESHVRVGRDVFIGAGSWIQIISRGVPDTVGEPRMVIGDGTSIAGSCVLSAASSIRIGQRVLMARNVYIADHGHAFSDPGAAVLDQGIRDVRPVEIGDGAWLGQNVFVGPGVHIGRGAVVGANSVVLDDVPDYSIAVGAPARIVRTFARRTADEDTR
jgi:acetyltransferase-like isoleucine patch superfamily enzyme